MSPLLQTALDRQKPKREYPGPIKLGTVAVAIVFCSTFIAPTLEKQAELPTAKTVSVNLAQCTPPHVRVTPKVEMTFNVFPDGDMEAVGCTRYQDHSPLLTSSVVQ